jgi:hypothetical protein
MACLRSGRAFSSPVRDLPSGTQLIANDLDEQPAEQAADRDQLIAIS